MSPRLSPSMRARLHRGWGGPSDRVAVSGSGPRWWDALLAAGAFMFTSAAFGNHITGTYGSRGYTWLARYTDMSGGLEWITSNYCTQSEIDAINDIRNSTAGTS